MPKRRAPGWAAINFVLPRQTIEELTLLTKSMAARKRASDQANRMASADDIQELRITML
jgi:hypothetical protein